MFFFANNAAFVFQESYSNAAIGTGSAVLANWSAANTVPKRSRNKYNYSQFEDRSIMFHCPCYIISCTQIEVGPTHMSRPYPDTQRHARSGARSLSDEYNNIG